jgi:hypothetical protein
VPAATIVEVLGLRSAPYYSAYLKATSSRLMAEVRLPQSGEIGYTPLDDFGSENAAVLKKIQPSPRPPTVNETQAETFFVEQFQTRTLPADVRPCHAGRRRF